MGGTGEGIGEHLWWWSWWVRALMVGEIVGEKGEGGGKDFSLVFWDDVGGRRWSGW